MINNSTFRAAALAGTCLLPLAAFADEAPAYDNQATVGFRYQSGDSALFGRYNGNPYKGFGAVGSFQLDASSPWDSKDTRYFTAEGNGLGFDSHQLMPDASLSVKLGNQGLWGVNVYYDGIPYWQSLTFHSLNASSGALQSIAPGSLSPNSGVTFTAVTTNPATGAVTGGGATPAQLAAAQTALATQYAKLNAANPVQAVGTQRDIVGGTASYSPIDNWTFSAGLQHEHKQGTKENSFVTNSTTNINYFPEPVDYDTDRYTATAKYNAKRLQALFSYTFSNFNDNLLSFNTRNPFIFTAAPGYTGTVYALPPSNDAHQFKGQVAYKLTPTTRINANFGYELMEQSSANTPAYAGAPASPYFAGGNVKAQAQNLFGNVVLTARPLANTDFRASYTVDDRKNDTPRVFLPTASVYPNADITADTTGSNHVPIANLPVSELKQTARLDGGYNILPSTKINLNYIYTDRQRDFSVTDRNHESTLGAKVLSSVYENVDASVGYSHSVRTASDYFANAAWLAATYTATNIPGAGMFYLAARTRDEISGDLSWSPNSKLSTSLTARFYNDHYPDSYFGVTNDHTLSVGPDLAYKPTKAMSTHFFYTFEEVFTGQNFSSSNNPNAARTDWTLGNKDTIHTVGAKADWQVNDKVKIGIEDNLSYGATAFAEGYALLPSSTGVPQTQTPTNIVGALPDDKTITNAVGVTGEYKLQSNVSLLGQYGYARCIAKDYLYGQAAGSPSNGNNVSSLGGDGNPSYAIHMISMAVRVKW